MLDILTQIKKIKKCDIESGRLNRSIKNYIFWSIKIIFYGQLKNMYIFSDQLKIIFSG